MLLQRFNLSRQESKFFLGKLICNIYESSTLVNLYRKIIFLSGAFQYLLSFKTSWYCLYLTRIFFRCFLNLVYFFYFYFSSDIWSNGLLVRVLDSQCSICWFKITMWLQSWLSLLPFKTNQMITSNSWEFKC